MAENEPVLAEAIAEDVVAKKPRGLILRLDNGTVISNRDEITKGTDEVVCLRPEDAYEAGLLSEAHLLRAQALLCEVHAKLPEEGPLRSISTGSKRSADTGVQIGESFKRSEGGPTPIASAPTTTMDTATWGPLAKNIINKTCEVIGHDAHLFQNPVNAELVADYYNIIKSPICWNEIVQKLDAGRYPTPIEFYNDADLLFRNCFTYNPVGTPVYNLGVLSENAFEKEWAKTPFSAMVPPKPRKRINAARGPRKPGGGGRGSFGNGGGGPMGGGGGSGRGRGAPPGPRRPPGRPPGVARTKSVNSYKAYQNLPPEKQAQLAQALQDESVLATKMNGVIQILRDANELGSNEEGEVELDLSKVSPSVVWALYEFIFGRGAAAAAPAPSMGPARSAGRLFTEDSDYDPMDEDDDE